VLTGGVGVTVKPVLSHVSLWYCPMVQFSLLLDTLAPEYCIVLVCIILKWWRMDECRQSGESDGRRVYRTYCGHSFIHSFIHSFFYQYNRVIS